MIDMQAFCRTDESPDKYYLSAPWSAGGYTYASNGGILIRVPRREDIPENENAPNVFTYRDVFNRKPKLGWHPVPAVTVDMIPCLDCNGRGKVFEFDNADFMCEDCAGTGKVEKIECIEMHPDCFVYFTNILLKLVGTLPDCEIGLNGGKEPCRLRFQGGDGIIMPCLYFDESYDEEF